MLHRAWLMTNKKYYLVQDGDPSDGTICNIFKKLLGVDDYKIKNGVSYYNFVGLVVTKDKTLISFPKHTFTPEKIIHLSENNRELQLFSKLLFKSISKASNRKDTGISDGINSYYPFSQFSLVYSYYRKYGLFRNEKQVKKFGYGGRISWKDTLNRSPKVISSGNLLFLPFIVKENVTQYLFISKCMAYVINSTLEVFSDFLDGERIRLNTDEINHAEKNYIISKLTQARRSIFKRVHQELLESLISFFQRVNPKGGGYQLKTHSYNLVWEDMVKDYLNVKFLGIDNRKVVWSKDRQKNSFAKKSFYPDILGRQGYRLDPDHYLIMDSVRYIFDAKYYQNLKGLDYKQVSYYFLLKHAEATRDSENNVVSNIQTYNALFLPTELDDHSEVHFELDSFYNVDEAEFVIMAYYINTINVMYSYTANT